MLFHMGNDTDIDRSNNNKNVVAMNITLSLTPSKDKMDRSLKL